MREPPPDDELWAALWLLFLTVVFVAVLLLAMYEARDFAVFVPPSSTLPRLGT